MRSSSLEKRLDEKVTAFWRSACRHERTRPGRAGTAVSSLPKEEISLLELGEHQKLSPGGSRRPHCADFSLPNKFTAVVFVIGARNRLAIAKDDCKSTLGASVRTRPTPVIIPSPGPPVLLQLIWRLLRLIERRLLAGQMAEGFDLCLVGQIPDDASLSVLSLRRIEGCTSRRVARRRRYGAARGEGLADLREGLRGAEQTRIDEVENTTLYVSKKQIFVFDRRAGEDDARLGLQGFDGPGLFGVGILDRLGLSREPPWQPGRLADRQLWRSGVP